MTRQMARNLLTGLLVRVHRWPTKFLHGHCLCCVSLCKWFCWKQRFADFPGSVSVTDKLEKAASYCCFVSKALLLLGYCFAAKSGYYTWQLSGFGTDRSQSWCTLGTYVQTVSTSDSLSCPESCGVKSTAQKTKILQEVSWFGEPQPLGYAYQQKV